MKIENDSTLAKLKIDSLFLLSVFSVFLFSFFAIRKGILILNWAIGILTIISIAIGFVRVRQSGFRFRQHSRLTSCSSLDDFEDWFVMFAMIFLILFIPADFLVKSISYISSKL
jgi:hypothetical protein